MKYFVLVKGRKGITSMGYIEGKKHSLRLTFMDYRDLATKVGSRLK